MNEPQNSKFKKGDRVFLCDISADGGKAYANAYPIEIRSMGKKQGTAYRLDLGRNALRQLYPSMTILATEEEVQEWAAATAPAVAERDRSRRLSCEESNFPNLRPEYREAATARIAALKSMTPIWVLNIWPAKVD